MKKIGLLALSVLVLTSCGAGKNLVTADKAPIKVGIDLINVKEDKVLVTLDPGAFTSENVTFYIPKTVPGTYSTDNYGKYIENFKAFDYKGVEMTVSKSDENTWNIANGKNLDRVSYYVNDTYDSESEQEHAVFSPAGTNILKGENFMLNLHGFVGYFKDLIEVPYELVIMHPSNLKATTSLKLKAAKDVKATEDVFYAKRYFEVTDNPILYAKSDIVSFEVNGITVNLSVYSPNGVYNANDLKDRMLKKLK
uniref:M61 family metallopeptidase n=1 Tax=Flavobacterium sp. TaxID=239 RepID=UPI004049022C